ncbi:MAG: protein kinase [Desulfatibacillum sp.]|nr:protein kinase [Desulfatibacillum sp.]
MAHYFSLSDGQSVESGQGVWYKNIHLLGKGGNSVAFLVLATSGPNKGNLFVLKVFRSLSHKDRKDKFLNEIQFLKNACDHPSIVRVFDYGVFNSGNLEFPFVVTEYHPLTLHEVIKTRKASMVDKLSYCLQLLSALAYLDSMDPKVIHRDIKPQNIFVHGKSATLADFGLMKLMDGHTEVDRDVFKESMGPGMPFYYRTPDLIAYAKNEADITTKSDVFQLGLVFAEMFTGRNPAIPPDDGDMLSPYKSESISWIAGNFGSIIAKFLYQMLEIDPDKRKKAKAFLDNFQGLFIDAIKQSIELEGELS